MNGKHLSLGITLCFAMSGACQAASSVAQGTIEFSGYIAGPNCLSSSNNVSGFDLNDCPFPGHANTMHASRIEPISSVTAPDHSAVNIKLLADSSQSLGHYDQKYQLVDSSGSPVRSGMYLITLTTP